MSAAMLCAMCFIMLIVVVNLGMDASVNDSSLKEKQLIVGSEI